MHLCLLAFLSGCTHPQAKTIPEAPPLDVPMPPPRVVEATDAELPQPVGLVAEPARSAPTRPRATIPAPPRADAPRAEAPKPETVPVDVPKPGDEPRVQAPSTLQTTPSEREADVERRTRAQLVQAAADLNRIDYRVLNPDARTQYDTAKRFISQAEDALRAKNLVFASNLAEKAAGLAAQLGAR